MTYHAADKVGPYSANRLFEWYSATSQVLIAVILALPGDTMSRMTLEPLTRIGMTEEMLAAFFGIVGAVRMLALYANGNINNGLLKPGGATIRMWCAAFSALVWGQMLFAFAMDALVGNPPGLGLALFAGLLMCEIISCYHARMDYVDRKDALAVALEKLRGV